jgi:heat shock protein HslJ
MIQSVLGSRIIRSCKMKKYLSSIVVLVVLTGIMLAACSAPGGLDATSWNLESYAENGGNVVDVLPGSVVMLDFQATQVSGSAGCNNYSGSYQTSGGNIEFGPMAATRKMCAQPLGIMEQESAYLAALEAAAEYDLGGNRLEIKNDRGDVTLIFVRATGDS